MQPQRRHSARVSCRRGSDHQLMSFSAVHWSELVQTALSELVLLVGRNERRHVLMDGSESFVHVEAQRLRQLTIAVAGWLRSRPPALPTEYMASK